MVNMTLLCLFPAITQAVQEGKKLTDLQKKLIRATRKTTEEIKTEIQTVDKKIQKLTNHQQQAENVKNRLKEFGDKLESLLHTLDGELEIHTSQTLIQRSLDTKKIIAKMIEICESLQKENKNCFDQMQNAIRKMPKYLEDFQDFTISKMEEIAEKVRKVRANLKKGRGEEIDQS